MDIHEQIASLYEKDTKTAYANLLALEELAKQENVLYPFLPEFIGMLSSAQYVMRVRGFRLLCLQAKWDENNIINSRIDTILAALQDKKPTAVRQMLAYLHYVLPYKKQLHAKIKAAALAIDLSRFKDTMMPLIEKDIHTLVKQV